jgi:hypothetical protein
LKGKSSCSPSPLALSSPFAGAAEAGTEQQKQQQQQQQKTTAAMGNGKTSGRATPKTRNTNSGLIIKRRSTPRAEFAARLCRAERMSPQVAAYFAEELDIDAPGPSTAGWSAADKHGLEEGRRTFAVSLARKLANHHAKPPRVGEGEGDGSQEAPSAVQELVEDLELPDDAPRTPEYLHAVRTLRKVPAPVLWYWSR